MSRKSKRDKVKKLEDSDSDFEERVRFEIEPDADELFARYLDNMPADLDKTDDEGNPGKPGQRKTEKKKEVDTSPLTIDLHGYRLDEAIYEVDRRIREILQSKVRITQLKVITGKGLHSGPEGSILAKEVYTHVVSTFRKNILRIDDSPAEVTFGGIPLRGYFVVSLTRKG